METWKEIDLNIKHDPIGCLLSCFWVLKVLMAVPERQPAPRIDVIMLQWRVGSVRLVAASPWRTDDL